MSIVVLKYFEEDCKYPKLIIKPVSYFISKMEQQGVKFENKIQGVLFINLIKNDDPFLEHNNTIVSIQYYSPKDFRYTLLFYNRIIFLY